MAKYKKKLDDDIRCPLALVLTTIPEEMQIAFMILRQAV